MIKVDGVKINKVFEIQCNHETGFNTHISFHADERLDDCTDPSSFDDYEVRVTEGSDEDIRYATLIFPNKEGYETRFVNDN